MSDYDEQSYDIAAIRTLLSNAFTTKTLPRFCQDRPRFRRIKDGFSSNDGLDDMVDKLIDYCEVHLFWDELLAAVKQEYPRQYARYESSRQTRSGALEPLPEGMLPESPSDRLIAPQDSLRPAEYISYISSERVASLFAQVDARTLADPKHLNRAGDLIPFGDAAVPAEMERKRRAAVSQLAVVLDYLEKTARICDLASIVRAREQLDCDWYFVETGFRSKPWDASTPLIYLSGRIEDYQLLLSCSKPNFAGLYREGDIYIPTSTNSFLFDGSIKVPLHGLVRLVATDPDAKVLRGTALYLVLGRDIGAL